MTLNNTSNDLTSVILRAIHLNAIAINMLIKENFKTPLKVIHIKSNHISKGIVG